jgi:branched-chain amino acid transport system permease protein
MMGFAGQLSLGHALYLGLGAYGAAALYHHFSVPPLAGLLFSIGLCAAVAASIGFLAFRYGVSGVYFTLLTIAFAEFTRIGFDHFQWVGGSGGLFLKVTQRDQLDIVNLRGTPTMFYYVMLSLTIAACVLCAWLLSRRPGYYWLAIRENEDAAQALGINTFRWKMLAVVISAGMTGVAGVFWAFYYNHLFPEQIFGISRSVEIILGPIIGGIGTLAGPLLGAVLLTLCADGVTELVNMFGWDLPGVKQLIYGIILFLVITCVPQGIWPALAQRLKLFK